MDLNLFLTAALLCLMPIAELRGGLPLLLASGVDPIFAYFFCIFFNSLITPFLLLFLKTLNHLFLKLNFYKIFYSRIIERTQKKINPKVDRWGIWGILIFVAIPLPFTGAYTGALGGWLLGLDMKKVFLAVTAGVCLAGLIVTAAFYLVSYGYESFKLFFK